MICGTSSVADNRRSSRGSGGGSGPYFVDFEAFQHGTEKYKIKEMCVIDVNRPLSPLYFIFSLTAALKPWDQLGLEQRKTYDYQSQHLHRLTYGEGVIPYCKTCIWRMIKHTFPTCINGIFYVIGSQKCAHLMNEFPKLNWCEYCLRNWNSDLPKIPPNISCLHRPHGDHCACLKCYRLYQHYITLTD